MKQNEDAAPSILDDVWRDALRYRFVRVADKVPISREAARDPAVYDEAIDRAMRERGCEGLPRPEGISRGPTQAVLDVLAERRRQIEAEGWTPEHDDAQHTAGELAGAAACYARHVNARAWVIDTPFDTYTTEVAPNEWPWEDWWWKPSTPRRDLVKAAALILAEIERLDRMAAAKPEASRG